MTSAANHGKLHACLFSLGLMLTPSTGASVHPAGVYSTFSTAETSCRQSPFPSLAAAYSCLVGGLQPGYSVAGFRVHPTDPDSWEIQLAPSNGLGIHYDGPAPMTDVDKNMGVPHLCAGNPINTGIGNKFQREIDYRAEGVFALRLERNYNALSGTDSAIGHHWLHAYAGRLRLQDVPGLGLAMAFRKDGRILYFTQDTNGVWIPDADVTDLLEELHDSAMNRIGWRYWDKEDGIVEIYSATGRLQSIADFSGRTHSLTYTLPVSSGGDDDPDTLDSVSDEAGRQLRFSYDGQKRISTVSNPAGGVTSYAYDVLGNLSTVTYPDGTTRTYHYEDPNFPHALTGITDENGHRYATWTYDAQGRAISSEHAGGAERVDLTYHPDGTTTVTDALGTARTYGFETVLGVVKGTAISQPGGAGCNAASSAMTHDAHGNAASRDDFNGHRTRHWHDLARNLETTRVEGLAVVNGSEQVQPETRTFTTAWHPTWRLPTEEKTYTGGADSGGIPLGTLVKTVTSTYDSQGNLLTRTETDNQRNESRTWTYTYLSLGRIASADGPRTDVADLTTYAYYPDDDADLARRGRLWKITNALGHVTTFDAYDLHGHVTRTTDPNGLITTFAYDLRGRLVSRAVGSRVTTYAYDPAGNLIGITLPDGTATVFSHDAAHRLIGIQDAQGNRMAYTLDGLGNRISEVVYDAQGNPVKRLTRQFDALGRLWQEIRGVNGQATVTAYGYDAQGNPTLRTDPLLHVTRATYDALDRLARHEDALQGHTDVARDVTDNITAVTDPKGLNTVYETDAFGQVRKETSPDRGVTTYTYDAAGNLKTRTDARGRKLIYSYDALNRLTKVDRPTGIDNTFTWDQGIHGVGRLTGMTDESGSTVWTYNIYGELTGKRQTHQDGLVRTVAHTYLNGQRTRLDYPSGAYVEYTWHQGRVTGIRVNGVPLLTDIQYQPFGAPKAWTWGNGQPYQQEQDPETGWTTRYPLGADLRTLSYDPAGRITAYAHNRPRLDREFSYDPLDRLTGQTGYQGSTTWAYDANGNRTRESSGGVDYPYTLAADSNRLLGVAGPVAKAYQYDAAGNVTADGTYGFSYNDFGRLEKVAWADKTTRYRYNGLGQRLQKNGRGAVNGPVHYFYDENGLLLGEYDGRGAPQQETVWLGDKPVAVLMPSGVYHVHADHLNTPRVLLDATGTPVWRWNGNAFGVGGAAQDPDKDEQKVTYNPRFSGQYFDKETGMHYNTFRDYEPRTGRYVQVDPIGLDGGINPYAYVGGNPLSFIDPLGLFFEFSNSQRSLTWVDPNTGTASPSTTWPARSGSSHLQPLPQGWYHVKPEQTPVPQEKASMTDTCGNAYKFRLSPQFETNRSGLLIHPDGGKPGTAGCIGAQGCTSSLRQFLESVLPGGSGGGLNLKVVP